MLTAAFSVLLPPAAVCLGAGCAVWGGGARPQASRAPGRSGKEEQAAEGARPQGEALPEERPQGSAEGWTGGADSAREAQGCRAPSRASPEQHHAGGASTCALRKRSETPEDATLTDRFHPKTGLKTGCGKKEAAGRSLRTVTGAYITYNLHSFLVNKLQFL